MPERTITRRNPVAASPLLRKGGVHQRPRSGERRLARQRLDQAVDEWWEAHGGTSVATRAPPSSGD